MKQPYPLRRFVPAAIGIVLAAASYITIAIRWSHLPARLATHWDSRGRVNGFMSRSATLVWTIGSATLAAAFLITLTVLAVRRKSYGGQLIGVSIGALITSIYTFATLDSVVSAQSDAAATPGPGLFRLAPVILAPVILVVVSVRAVAMSQPVGDIPLGTRVDLAPGERAVWIGSLTAWPMLLPPLFIIALGVVLAATLRLWAFLALVPLGILLCGLGHIRVRVDSTGLRVFYGVGSLISTHIDANKIVHADAIDVKPTAWGGWGYRGSLKLFKRAAVVLRRGPGIRLQLSGGEQFAVTIDHPDDAAALLNTYGRGSVTPR